MNISLESFSSQDAAFYLTVQILRVLDVGFCLARSIPVTGFALLTESSFSSDSKYLFLSRSWKLACNEPFNNMKS